MKTACDFPVSPRVSRPRDGRPLGQWLRSLIGAAAAVCGLAAPAAWSGELLQNGGFDAGLDHWSLPDALVEAHWQPVEDGVVSLHPVLPGAWWGYEGDVLQQPLNVAAAGGKTLSVSLALRKLSVPEQDESTISVHLEYVTTGGVLERVKALDVPNGEITEDPDAWTPVQAEVSLPATARKLTKLILVKQGWGELVADEASLTCADLSPGPVPALQTVAGSGAYGSLLTLTGADFGATADRVLVGGRADGLSVQSWAGDEVRVLVAAPARGGVVRLLQDFTESWGGVRYAITSPTFELFLAQDAVEVIRGAPARLTVGVDFLNGYTSAGGIGLTVPEAPAGVASFSPVPLKGSGGALLTLNTAGLAPGVYAWTVQSVEAGAPPRSVPFTLRVSTVARAVFFNNAPEVDEEEWEVTALTLHQQGEVWIGFELRDAQDRLLPLEGCEIESSQPSVLLALTRTSNGGFRTFAQDEGAAQLRVLAPDGFVGMLPVTVADLPAERVGFVGFTQAFPANSGSARLTFQAFAEAGLGSVGQEGLLDTEPALPLQEGVWSGDNRGFSTTFRILQGQQAGVFLFRGSNDHGSRHAPLTVINSPAQASLKGEIRSLEAGAGQMHGAEGMVEFYSPTNADEPLFSRGAWNWQGSDYDFGGLPPGSYKLRFTSFLVPEEESPWYPNARSHAEAQTLVLKAGVPVAGIHFFTPGQGVKFVRQPEDRIVAPGDTVQFLAEVRGGGSGELAYRWFKDGAELEDDMTYSGTGTPVLSLTGADLGDNGSLFQLAVYTEGADLPQWSREARLQVGDFAVPVVETYPPTHELALLRAARAVVAGRVNPDGTPADVIVEWGTSRTALTRITRALPATVADVAFSQVTAELTGLSGSKTYHYRFRATSAAGSATGEIFSFKTPAAVPPVVKTLAPEEVTQTSARLQGTVDPRGGSVTGVFDYGPTNALGFSLAAAPLPVEGTGAQPVTATVNGLLPHTKYFFRLRAAGDNGAANGGTLSFVTANGQPVAGDDSYAVLPASPVLLNVFDNDSDPDGDALSVQTFTKPAASVGKVAKAASGLWFTPAAGFTGGTFTYTVKDGFGGFATATVTLTQAEVSVNPPVTLLPAAGGAHVLTILTEASWTAVENLPWVSVAPASGLGNAVVTVTVQPNSGKTVRTGVVSVGGQWHQIEQAAVIEPVISVPVEIPGAIVGGWYHLAIPTTGAPVTYKVTNLPPGLVLTQATGVISGRPLKPGDYEVKLIARNAVASSNEIQFLIPVRELPGYAQGGFTALLERDATLNDMLGGVTDLTVTATGAISGSLRLGAARHAFKGQLEVPLTGDPTANLTVPRRGLPAVELALVFDQDEMERARVGGTAVLENAGSPPVALGGQGHPWGKVVTAQGYAGYYTAALRHDEDPGDESLPQGASFLTFKALATGKVTWSGRLADGTACTGSSTLWSGGGLPIYLSLYAGQGSLQGAPRIELEEAEAGILQLGDPLRAFAEMGDPAVTWFKKPQASRVYGDGFGPLVLGVFGGEFVPPGKNEIVMGIEDVAADETNAFIEFEGAGVQDTEFGTSLTQYFRINTAHKAFFSKDAEENPAKLKVTQINRSTGLFSGSFTLVDFNEATRKNETRTVPFQGVILQGLREAWGYFLLPELTAPPAKAAQMPQKSGWVWISP